MSWLLLAALGMIWAAFLLPTERRRPSPQRSVEDFERNMDLLAETDRGPRGRWIVTPRKGVPFVGTQARAQARARERRRRVFVFLLECIGFTFLIGLVPPLRAMWYGTALLAALLGVYVWLLLSLKNSSPQAQVRARTEQAAVPDRPRPARQRYASDAAGRTRASFNGLGALGADDLVNIVVRPAREVGVVRA
jgi:hypothetical protein